MNNLKRKSNIVPFKRRVERRPIKYARGVPRPLFNGYCQFTRSINTQLNITAGVGWSIGAGSASNLTMVFDPLSVLLYGSAVNFITAALPSAAEIGALWDLVMLYKVEITVDHVNDPGNTGTVSSTMPRMAICNDYNDGQAGTSLDRIQQHSDCKVFTGRTSKWTVYPKHQRVIYFNAATSSYEPARGFVNSATAIPHYGTHIGILDPSVLLAGRTMFNFKLFFKAKNTK